MANVADRLATDRAERKRQRRGRSRTGLTGIRLSEINRLLTGRYRSEALPDNPDVRRAVVIVAHHLAGLARDPRRTIPSWLELRAPWYSLAEVKALLFEVIGKPKRWKAQTLAWQLKVIQAERIAFSIRTIGAIDLSPADRKAQRKEKARLRERYRRRASGIRPRAEYLVRVHKPQPWRALGISRRTWYRRGKPSC